MRPSLIVLDAVEEVSLLDAYLTNFGYAELHLDKILYAIYVRLQERCNGASGRVFGEGSAALWGRSSCSGV
jgi:hypothetical protein